MNLLDHSRGRAVLFTLLYLSEGAPMGLIWWALPTLLREQGLSVDRITGLTSLLVLPWAMKFLWAPLVDCLRTSQFGFRAWIMAAQTLMGLSLIPLTIIDPASSLPVWSTFLLIHAFAAATQDVAVDALAVHCVPNAERGRINGCMQAGMLIGRSLFAGGTLWMVDKIGLNAVFWALIACVWSSLSLLLFVREPDVPIKNEPRFQTFRETMSAALTHRITWVGLAFALTGAAAFETVGALLGPFLIDHGVAKETIGSFLAVPAVGAMMAGGLIGGTLSDRWGRSRSVGIFLIGFVVMILALAGLDYALEEPPIWALLTLLGGMYLFIGLFTAASYAMFMDLTNPKLGATQFSTFMAATNGCESWSGRAGGNLAAQAGYPTCFAIMCLVSLASLPLLRFLSAPSPPQPKGEGRMQNAECGRD